LRERCSGPFVTCLQSQQLQVVKFSQRSAGAGAGKNRPAFVVAVPLKDVSDNFTGMLAAVVSLDPIVHRFAGSKRAGTDRFFLVDHNGRLVAHPDTKKLRSWRGRQQRFACCASEGAAAGASQHGNGSLYYRDGQETPGRDDRDLQHFFLK